MICNNLYLSWLAIVSVATIDDGLKLILNGGVFVWYNFWW